MHVDARHRCSVHSKAACASCYACTDTGPIILHTSDMLLNVGAQCWCSNEVYNLTTGQVGIAPQGLPHYMANLGCSTVNFTQSFSNRDPGTITLSNALSK